MKKEFEAPKFEVIRFSVEEIITASGLHCSEDTPGSGEDYCLFD